MAMAPSLCSGPSRLSVVTGYCHGLISTLAFWLTLTLPYGSDYQGQVALALPFVCLFESVFSKHWQPPYVSSHMMLHNEMLLLRSAISFFSLGLDEPVSVVVGMMLLDS